MIARPLLSHSRKSAERFLACSTSFKPLAGLLVAGLLFQGVITGQSSSAGVKIQLRPAAAVLSLSQTEAFTATVTGASTSAVTWMLSPAIGSISSSGIYTAPATIIGTQTVTVKATSVADTTKSATATLTVNPPIAISLTPATATLTSSQTQTFTASITNMSSTAVSWSLNPAVGAITAAGLYTAPAFIGSPQTIAVTATSVADPSRSSSASVSLLSSGLVGYWPFDESSGSIAHDASGSGNNGTRSEEHTSELQSLRHLVCRLLLEKK